MENENNKSNQSTNTDQQSTDTSHQSTDTTQQSTDTSQQSTDTTQQSRGLSEDEKRRIVNSILGSRQQTQQTQNTQQAHQSDDDDVAETVRRTLQEERQRAEREDRVEKFKRGMANLVNTPFTVGNVTVGIESQSEYDDFRRFVGDTLKQGVTPADLYTLHNLNKIIELARQDAVRDFESKLKKGRSQQASQQAFEQNNNESASQSTPVGSGSGEEKRPAFGRPGKVPGIGELLEKRNPSLARQIQSGQVDLEDLLNG